MILTPLEAEALPQILDVFDAGLGLLFDVCSSSIVRKTALFALNASSGLPAAVVAFARLDAVRFMRTI